MMKLVNNLEIPDIGLGVYKISEKCISCGACAGACPMQCISQGDERYVIDESVCIGCGTCANVCPMSAPEPQE